MLNILYAYISVVENLTDIYNRKTYTVQLAMTERINEGPGI